MAATKKDAAAAAPPADDTPPPAPKPGQEEAAQDDNTSDMRTTRMPKGFVPQGAQSAPWWKLEEGNVLYGRIRGALFTMQDNRRTEYFQVQLHEPTLAEEGTKRAGNRRTITVPKGALVSVSIKKKMEILKTKVLLEQQAGAEEGEGDRRHDDDGDRHRQVAPEPDPHLVGNEADPHTPAP